MAKCIKCGKPIRNNRSICTFCDGYMCGYDKGRVDEQAKRNEFFNFDEVIRIECDKARADERTKVIAELHKELEMQIRENSKIIYVDNKDYLSVARGSVLQVIHETLEQLKEQK